MNRIYINNEIWKDLGGLLNLYLSKYIKLNDHLKKMFGNLFLERVSSEIKGNENQNIKELERQIFSVFFDDYIERTLKKYLKTIDKGAYETSECQKFLDSVLILRRDIIENSKNEKMIVSDLDFDYIPKTDCSITEIVKISKSHEYNRICEFAKMVQNFRTFKSSGLIFILPQKLV